MPRFCATCRLSFLILLLIGLVGCSAKRGLEGTWTTITPDTVGKSAGIVANLPTKTSFDFESGGKETITLSLPSGSTVVVPAKYTTSGQTLTQSIPPANIGFSDLGLIVTQSPAAVALTCQYQIQGDKLMLSQPVQGRAVTLTRAGG